MAKSDKKKGFWANAFSVEKAEDFVPTKDELAILDKVAEKFAGRGLSLPAILFLETTRPMNYIGAQAMAFFEPVVRTLFSEWDTYTRFYKILERRGSIECLIERIEYFESRGKEKSQADTNEEKSSD